MDGVKAKTSQQVINSFYQKNIDRKNFAQSDTFLKDKCGLSID
jgi:hypothetical protein